MHYIIEKQLYTWRLTALHAFKNTLKMDQGPQRPLAYVDYNFFVFTVLEIKSERFLKDGFINSFKK